MANGTIVVACLVGVAAGTFPMLALGGDTRSRDRDVSPALQVEPRVRDGHRDHDAPRARDVRSYDGSGNHLGAPERNASHEPLARLVPPAYADGASSPACQVCVARA